MAMYHTHGSMVPKIPYDKKFLNKNQVLPNGFGRVDLTAVYRAVTMLGGLLGNYLNISFSGCVWVSNNIL